MNAIQSALEWQPDIASIALACFRLCRTDTAPGARARSVSAPEVVAADTPKPQLVDDMLTGVEANAAYDADLET